MIIYAAILEGLYSERRGLTGMEELYAFPTFSLGMILILCTSVISILAFVWNILRFRTKKSWKTGATALAAFAVSLISTVIVCGMLLSMMHIRADIAAQNYSTAIGCVENYDLSGVSDHDKESFQVSGVRFEYRSSELTWYYCKTQGVGGVIKGNGQYVMIRYITDEESRNRIVYIAEDSGKSRVTEDAEISQKISDRNKEIFWTGFAIIAVLLLTLIILLIRRIRARAAKKRVDEMMRQSE